MLQLVYVSSVNPTHAPVAVEPILRTSRRNNQRDEITGLLYADGRRFLQVLEGPEHRVNAAFERIKADPQHRAIVILSRRDVADREFGRWEMAQREPGEDGDAFVERVGTLIEGADPDVRATFQGFVAARRSA